MEQYLPPQSDKGEWRRFRIDEAVELEFWIDSENDSSRAPSFSSEEGGGVCLEFANFSGPLRLRLASVGEKADDSIPDEPKSDQDNKPEKPKGPRVSHVSFHPTTSAASQATNRVAWLSNDSHISRSSVGVLRVSRFALPRHSMAMHVPGSSAHLSSSSGFSLGSHKQKRPTLPSHQLSERTIAQAGIVDENGQNELHRLCGTSSINVHKIQAIMEKQPELATQVDDNGLLPLHVLGNNGELINHTEGQVLARQVAYLLMEVHPDGLTHKTNDGQIPFTQLIKAWVEWTIEESENTSRHNKSGAVASNSAMVSSLNDGLQTRTLRSGVGDLTTASEHGSSSYLKFPPVPFFEDVKWCFEMLSVAIEHLGGMPLDTAQNVRLRLAYSKQRSDRERLAANVASIPNLLKTILLLESKETSKLVLESPLLRRMLFCPDAYGDWLPQMMRQKNEPASEIAVRFLSTISLLDVKDFVGTIRKPFPLDEQLFHEAKLSVYECLERLEGTIPSLLVMDEDLGDRALATPLITFIMGRRIITPFSVALCVSDLHHNISLLAAFQEAAKITQVGSQGILSVVNPRSVIIVLLVQQIIRRVLEVVLLSKISRKAARKHIHGGWQSMDYIAILMAAIAKTRSHRSDDEIPRPLFFAFVLSLLWARLLGLFRVLNEHLATFILAVSRIVSDLKYFFLVFFLIVWMMGDMFRVVFTNSEDIDCEGNDLGVPEDDFCKQNSIDPYFRVYSVIVGDFEYEDYSSEASVRILWTILTFLGTVILLNVLIAVVTLSYASCQESSLLLFRRARAEYCATHSILEGFVFPNDQLLDGSLKGLFTWIAQKVIEASYFVTMGWCSIYIFARFADAISSRNPALIVVFAIGSLVAFYGSVAGAVCFGLMYIDKYLDGTWLQRHAQRILNSMNDRVVRFTGIDTNDTEGGGTQITTFNVDVKRHEELVSRLERLERTLEHARSWANSTTNSVDQPDGNENGGEQDSIYG